MRRLLLALCLALGLPLVTNGADSPLDRVQLDTATLVGQAGFFRVGKDTQGRWWFVTPEDRPFFYRGVTSINEAGTPGGRRAKPGVYTDAVRANYTSKQQFAEAQIQRLRKWGFNGLGAWCEADLFDLNVDGAVMPYTEILEFGYVGPQIVARGIKLPDVFDPAWERAIDAWAKKLCTPRRDSPYLLGYFTDNELGWAQPTEEDIAAQSVPEAAKNLPPKMFLLQQCLTAPGTSGSYKAAWEFVSKRYDNDLPALSKAWGVSISDGDSIRKLNPNFTRVVEGDGMSLRWPVAPAKPAGGNGLPEAGPKLITTAKYFQDQDAFSLLFARRYFQLSAEAIRKHDPNHLILGCRFGGPPGAIILAGMKKQWVDVVSANNYRPNMYERMNVYYEGTGLPVLNGEFSYHSGLFQIKGHTAEGMAKLGAQSLEELFSHPAVIGYTWYRWDAADPAPKNLDGSPISCGLVNERDEPVKVHVETLTSVNAKADAIATRRKSARAVQVPNQNPD